MTSQTKSTKGSGRAMTYQASDKGFAVEVGRNGLIGDDPKEWHQQMNYYSSLYERSNFENQRITQVISLTKEEAKEMKTAKDWENLAITHFEKKGVDLNNHAYIMHTHDSTKNPHMHITVNRVTFDGKMGIKIEDLGMKFGKISDEIAKERGWLTAKEIGENNRREAGRQINETLKTAQNFNQFQQQMKERGYVVNLYENEGKGVFGMRVIPAEKYTENPSRAIQKSGQGYKLSEIEKNDNNKAKFKIEEIKNTMEKNQHKAQEQGFSPKIEIDLNQEKSRNQEREKEPEIVQENSQVQEQELAQEQQNQQQQSLESDQDQQAQKEKEAQQQAQDKAQQEAQAQEQEQKTQLTAQQQAMLERERERLENERNEAQEQENKQNRGFSR